MSHAAAVSGEARLRAWEERTFAFLAEQGFAPHGAVLLLAVSGGADSMALLEFWARAGAPRFGCRLMAVHVHHGLRASADLDQELVVQRCRQLRIPLACYRLHADTRRPGESMEMWARRERYRCFQLAAAAAPRSLEAAAPGTPNPATVDPAPGTSTPAPSSTGAPSPETPATADSTTADPATAPLYILTAHHRDDLVETVFQRLGRGTGARGLGGIPFRRAPGIVRPLLDRSRAEILAYLGMLGARWREDESNADLRIGRNAYRHAVLPVLRAAEPGLDARVFRMAMAIQRIGDGLLRLEEDAALLREDAGGRPCLAAAAVEERLAGRDSQSLRHWLGRLAEASARDAARPAGEVSPLPPVTEEILRELHRQWRQGAPRLRVPVGPGHFLERRNDGFYWEIEATGAGGRPGSQRRVKKECPLPGQRIILDRGHAAATWRWGERSYALVARAYPRPRELHFPGSGEGRAIFDADLFSCTLLVRIRKDGDRFSPLGIRSESRKLKTFMNEERIPVGNRDTLPLVFAGWNPGVFADGTSGASGVETLAWVPGHGISEFFKVSDRTAHILEMELTCLNP